MTVDNPTLSDHPADKCHAGPGHSAEWVERWLKRHAAWSGEEVRGR